MHDRDSVRRAIRNAADAYTSLREDFLPENIVDDAASRAILDMLNAYSERV
jgi:hypothetical protein